MMKAAIVVVVIMVMAAIVPGTYCTTHMVGDSSGWTQGVDYSTWASGQTFAVGDTLVFAYSANHAVNQVRQSDYTSCNTGNAIQSYIGGSNIITLTTAGPLYFICPTPGHCQSGMKLAITIGASSTAPSASPTTPSTSPSTPASNPPPPTLVKSGSVGSSNVLVIGVSVLATAVIGLMC